MSSRSLEDLADRIPYGGLPVPGILTAGQFNAGQLQQLGDAGVRAIIDIRAPEEGRGFDEAGEARKAGLEYHNIPVVQGAVGAAEFDAIRAILRDDARRPVVVHCATANRVGAALIPWLMLDEKLSRDEALRVAREIGLRSDVLARTALDYVDNAGSAR